MIKYEKKYISILKNATKELKSFNNEYFRSEKNFITKGKRNNEMFETQKKLICEIKFYITYLGYLDALIVKQREQLEFFWNLESNDELGLIQEQYEFALTKRENLVYLIEENSRILDYYDLLSDIIYSIPSCDKFHLLYDNNIVDRPIDINVYLEFINAYNTGYMQEKNINWIFASVQFEKYFKDLESHKNKKAESLIRLRQAANVKNN